MTEAEYEAWFDKYLRDIESLNKIDVGRSPLSRIPKPLNRKTWMIVCIIGLVVSMAISCLFSWIYEMKGLWFFNWISNTFLSLSLGVVASLLIMGYTNARERNVAFYSDIIPVLENRHENMHKAYFDYSLKIDRFFNSHEYEKCYDAWHANCNTCLVILEFLRYLHTVLPFHPKSLTSSLEKIEKAEGNLTEANEKISKEYFAHKMISEETEKLCCHASNCGLMGLYEIESLIQELKCNLYGIKYGKASKAVNDKDVII